MSEFLLLPLRTVQLADELKLRPLPEKETREEHCNHEAEVEREMESRSNYNEH